MRVGRPLLLPEQHSVIAIYQSVCINSNASRQSVQLKYLLFQQREDFIHEYVECIYIVFTSESFE